MMDLSPPQKKLLKALFGRLWDGQRTMRRTVCFFDWYALRGAEYASSKKLEAFGLVEREVRRPYRYDRIRLTFDGWLLGPRLVKR